jgi:hypothetical protein
MLGMRVATNLFVTCETNEVKNISRQKSSEYFLKYMFNK